MGSWLDGLVVCGGCMGFLNLIIKMLPMSAVRIIF